MPSRALCVRNDCSSPPSKPLCIRNNCSGLPWRLLCARNGYSCLRGYCARKDCWSRSCTITQVTSCTDCYATPRVTACTKLWQSPSYGMHRVTAWTELRHAPSYGMHRFTLECSGREHIGRNGNPKATFTYENSDIFNIFVFEMLRICQQPHVESQMLRHTLKVTSYPTCLYRLSQENAGKRTLRRCTNLNILSNVLACFCVCGPGCQRQLLGFDHHNTLRGEGHTKYFEKQ